MEFIEPKQEKRNILHLSSILRIEQGTSIIIKQKHRISSPKRELFLWPLHCLLGKEEHSPSFIYSQNRGDGKPSFFGYNKRPNGQWSGHRISSPKRDFFFSFFLFLSYKKRTLNNQNMHNNRLERPVSCSRGRTNKIYNIKCITLQHDFRETILF